MACQSLPYRILISQLITLHLPRGGSALPKNIRNGGPCHCCIWAYNGCKYIRAVFLYHLDSFMFREYFMLSNFVLGFELISVYISNKRFVIICKHDPVLQYYLRFLTILFELCIFLAEHIHLPRLLIIAFAVG